MPLPQGFSEFEFLQDVIRRWQNRIVREEFSDLGGDEFDPDINISRHAIRHACTIKDNDTAEMTMMRLYAYYFIYRKAQDLQPPIYGIPSTSFQSSFVFKPQVMLYFQEPESDIEPGYPPVKGEISFRIADEESTTITQTKVNQLATRVRDAFARPPFEWHKGKIYVSYIDKPKGYKMQLLCRSKAEGKRVIEQVLDVQSHTPVWKNMNVSEKENEMEAFPTVPPMERILGKNRRMQRRRPIATVKFRYAVLHVHGVYRPICLVDRSGIFANPVIAA
jgi:hypothetical protein